MLHTSGYTGRHTRVYIPLRVHREAYPGGIYTSQVHREAYPGGIPLSGTQEGIYPGLHL